ncbi:MAG: sodium:proton antiporter [Proteobacteria bacterium SG_bin9]|nr:MAG: sodium:proton antiporter [Proteobacteria bacterium SG_bin9]
MAVTKDQVLAALAAVATPRGVPLTKANVLSDIIANDGKVFFSINVDAKEAQAWDSVRAAAEAAVRNIAGVTTALVALTAERQGGAAPRQGVPPAGAPRGAHQHQHAHSTSGKPAPIHGVESVIAVASGKGGVGKSTTALNLALGLRDLGLRVGLLDADIYGPSVPRLIGVQEKPQLDDDRRMIPISRFGLSIMSIGFLVADDMPMIWRGPMIMSAITQMLREVAWGKLDVLVIDLPPGTGDAQLTLSQQAPLNGAVIVSTPQDLALMDARRGVTMFRQVNVPVLGVIENMSYFQCPECGTRSDIFGHGGARSEAERLGVPFLGEIPLDLAIRTNSDQGTPVVDSVPNGPHAAIYRAIAGQVRDVLRPVAASA